MELYHRLLHIQNQTWFFKYKEFFCERLKRCEDLAEIFLEAQEQFPELGERLDFPLRLPSPSLSFRWILYGRQDYPLCFYEMIDPPLLLTVLGSSCWIQEAAISVVGSREPTQESLEWLEEELGSFIEKRRPVVVSGGARGLDQAAHALALRKKVPTLVFLPSGLGDMYPSSLKAWRSQVVDGGGCFVSEYPLQQRMDKSLFHHRNRLIAQMGLATLVVQASERSGTLMTGHLAFEAGRPLWVVPGHPLRRVYRGNLNLLREGGTMICSAEDLSLFFEAEEISLNNKSAYLAARLLGPTICSEASELLLNLSKK